MPWVREVRRLAGVSVALDDCGDALEVPKNDHSPLSGAVGFGKTQMVRAEVCGLNT
jgi:hypothetical protein